MRKMILGLILMIAMVGTSAAPSASVFGIVYMSDGTTPVAGALVTAYLEPEHTTVLGTDTSQSSGFYSIYMNHAALACDGNVYLTAVKDGTTGTATATLSSTNCLDVCSIELEDCVDILIPEFPTVALPVAAIIGLAFLFQRRKEE